MSFWSENFLLNFWISLPFRRQSKKVQNIFFPTLLLEKDQHKAKFAHLNIDYPGFRSPFHSPLNVPAFKHRIQLPTTWLLVLFESSLLINCAFSNQILNRQSIRSWISSVNTCNQPTNLLNIHQSSESEIESRRQRHQKFSPSLFVFVRRIFYLLVYANFKFIYCFFISFFCCSIQSVAVNLDAVF